MKLSEERQSHLVHLIIESVWDDDLVDYADDEMALRFAKKAMTQWAAEEDNTDQAVRQKLSSLKRNVQEGTPEWEILYKKYYEEELRRRGQG